VNDDELEPEAARAVVCAAVVTTGVSSTTGAVVLIVVGLVPSAVMTVVLKLFPASLAAVRDTVYVPISVNVWVGFFSALVEPSPNDQSHEVGLPDEVSLNRTVRGALPEVTLAVNDATGELTGATAI